MYRSASFLLFVLALSSCQKDLTLEEPATAIDQDIPQELIPHFASFQRAAEERGLQVDFAAANVTAEMEVINQVSVAGTCTTNGHTLRHIVIYQSFWDRATYLVREMIVFHELGHCILGRGHKEAAFENGICQSIMRSGTQSCIDAYTANNRDYFLDELFGGEQ